MASFSDLFNWFQSPDDNKPKNGRDALVNQSMPVTNTAVETFAPNPTTLTEKQIMGIPAVSAGVDMISDSIAKLPIELYQKTDNVNGREQVTDDYRLDLINKRPNNSMTGYDLKRKVAKDVVLYGSSKSYIEYVDENSNTINAIYPLDMSKLTIEVKTINGYSFSGLNYLDSNAGRSVFYDELLLSVLKDTNNGITGKGLINSHYDILQLAIAQSEYEKNLMNNGATPTSVLETAAKVSNDVMTRVRNSWRSLYSGPKNAGKTVILEQGLSYKPISYGPDKLQLTEGKKSVISDIARILNIPESMINAAANKYDSTEQNNLWFLQSTLMPLLVSFQDAMNNSLLTEDEKLQGYEFQFNTTDISQITTEQKSDLIIKQFGAGVIDNVKAAVSLGFKVEKDEVPYYKVTTGTAMYTPSNGQLANPNTGTIMNVQDGSIIVDGRNIKGQDNEQPDKVNVKNDKVTNKTEGGTDGN